MLSLLPPPPPQDLYSFAVANLGLQVLRSGRLASFDKYLRLQSGLLVGNNHSKNLDKLDNMM